MNFMFLCWWSISWVEILACLNVQEFSNVMYALAANKSDKPLVKAEINLPWVGFAVEAGENGTGILCDEGLAL